MSVVTFANLGDAITRAVRQGAVEATRNITARGGVEISDRVRVATGANRASTTASSGVREVVQLPRTSHPPKGRGDFEREIRGLRQGETAFITQGQPYSAAREAKDGAVQGGVDAMKAAWKSEGEKAWPPKGERR